MGICKDIEKLQKELDSIRSELKYFLRDANQFSGSELDLSVLEGCLNSVSDCEDWASSIENSVNNVLSEL